MLRTRCRRYESINIITPDRFVISPQRQAWEHDIPGFATSCLPNNFPFQFTPGHLKLIELCQIQNEAILISAFRSYGKSSIATFLDPLHKIAHHHVPSVAFFGFNQNIALQFSGAIKTFLEETPDASAQFRNHYKDICGQVKGPKEDYKTRNGVRVLSFGIGQSPRSKLDLSIGERLVLCIVDDYESDDSARSQIQTKHIIEFIFKAISPALRLESMGGHYFRLVNTTITPISAQTTLLNDKERNLKRFFMPLVNADGKSTWEAAVPTRDLEKKRRKEGLVAWHSEFLLNPLSSDTQIFQDAWFRFIPADHPHDWYALTVGAIDIAPTTKRTSDYKAIVIMGIRYDPTIKITVRYAWQTHANNMQFWRKVYELQCLYDCEFAVESNMLHEFLKDSIDKYQMLSHNLLRLFPVYHSKDKNMRMSQLETPVSTGEIEFIENHSHQVALIDQMKAFPNAVNDDLHDAAAECRNQIIHARLAYEDISEQSWRDNPLDSLEREW